MTYLLMIKILILKIIFNTFYLIFLYLKLMKDINDVIFIIQARTGSSRTPKKND